MRKKNIMILVLSLFLVSLVLSVTPARAEEKVYTTADADTYVMADNPNSNYGYYQILYVRASGYISEVNTYLHFSFTDKPENWIKAEIKIKPQTLPIPFQVSIYLITEVWDEYTLTWINRPSLGGIITSLTLYTTNITFDVSNFITGDGISICLKTTFSNQIGYLSLYSREWTNSQPQLIWTYDPNVPDAPIENIINGYNILLIILSTLAIIFIVFQKQRTYTRTI